MVISSLTSYYRVNLFKSPNANSDNANNVWNVGDNADNDNANNDNGGRAALYLKSNVQIKGGDGSKNNPYKLS